MATIFRTALRAAPSFKAYTPRLATRPAPSAFSKPSFVPKQAFTQPRVAAFHTSKSLGILPPGPQHIEGTINDAVPVPESHPTHGSYNWSFERLVSVALVPLTVAPFAMGSASPVTDALLGATVVIHSHLGFESMIIDYIPARKYPRSRKVFMWGLKGATVLVLVGLYEFQTNDVGITEAVKRIWKA